jgi:hypothetical protein
MDPETAEFEPREDAGATIGVPWSLEAAGETVFSEPNEFQPDGCMKKKVLIIEDVRALRANLVDLLELENYQTLAAADGVEGVAMARSGHPDLILCDVMMPKLDGHGVLAALQDDPVTARIPFVFLTARGERSDVRAGMDSGADDYLVKPVPREELLAAVKARLDRAGRQRMEFKLEYKSARPLEALGLTPREAEVLFWTAQGKTNAEIGVILGVLPSTAKTHLENIYEKLQVDGRHNATLRAIEVLSTRDGSLSVQKGLATE